MVGVAAVLGIGLFVALAALGIFVLRNGFFPIAYAAYVYTPVGPYLHRKALERTRGAWHSTPRVLKQKRTCVLTVPMMDDNYAFILVDRATGSCALVDPADADRCEEVFTAKEDELAGLCERRPRLTAVLCTHKHWDHAGGNKALHRRFPALTIHTGWGDRSTAYTHLVREGDVVPVGETRVHVLETPGHTRGHVIFHTCPPAGAPEEGSPGLIFTGDTLFVAGVGKFFEGTPQEMHDSLKKLMGLPSSALVLCGHEYSVANLKFTTSVDPDNADAARKLEEAEAVRAKHESVVPTTLGEERLYNPFLRAVDGTLTLEEATTSVDAVRLLRCWKDNGTHPGGNATGKKAAKDA